MTTIVTRAGKGSPLTHTEVDTNFTNLNTNKLEAGAIALGSAATPSISFTGDLNTGIYSPDADQVAVATNGVERLRLSSTGEFMFKGAGTTPGTDKAVYFSGSAPVNSVVLDSSGRLLVGTSSHSGANLLQVNSDALVNGLTVGRGLASISTNTAVGNEALKSNTTGGTNTAVGNEALKSNTSGAENTATGLYALRLNVIGNCNTANGRESLASNTGDANTAIGHSSGYAITSGAGNISIGGMTNTTAISPVFATGTENNRISMGSTAVTNAYIQVAWTIVSDARDKTNFAPVPHGLDFVNLLKPTAFQFKLDRESDEINGPVRYGFKAQDILALEGENSIIIDSENPDKLYYNGESLIPVLVNAIKELSAKNNALEVRLAALEGA